ncbi:MAG: peroxiredoxin-like family protein [Balneolaceae bacterium]|nr:peroxiredoxin-like family protein [Balneolaceae bacterium]
MKYYSLISVICLALLLTNCMNSPVPERAEDVSPVETGEIIPDVTLKTVFNHDANLRELVSEKPTLLIFYRGGWCPYCNKHLSQLAEIEEQLYDRGIQVLAVSPDKPSYLKESTMEHELNYRLLSDSDMNATKKFGLAFKVDTVTVNRYKKNGLDLAKRSGYDHYMLPVPAAFLVDTTAVIRYRYFNPDYTVRIENDEILSAVGKILE